LLGRSLYENIQRFILFQLTINVAALGLAVLGPFLGIELPLTVMQMLWVNLIMDTFAALALATEPPNPAAMTRPPRNAGAFIVSREMARSIFGVGGLFLAIMAALLLTLKLESDSIYDDGGNWETTIIFTTFVLLQFWNLMNAKCLHRPGSVFPNLFANRSFLLIAGAILVGQILIVQFGGRAFRTVPLSLVDWLVLLGLTSAVLWIGEIVRWRRTN
jgi:P-type Ca2+ transporter type 2C